MSIFCKLFLSLLFIFLPLFASDQNNANVVKAEQNNTSIVNITSNPFQEKHLKDRIHDYLTLKENFSAAWFNNETASWFRPKEESDDNSFRVQLLSKNGYLTCINLEISFRKSNTYTEQSLQYANKVYNFVFPEWKDDGFLEENFSKVLNEKSIWITRNNIIFRFCYYKDLNSMQVLIEPK